MGLACCKQADEHAVIGNVISIDDTRHGPGLLQTSHTLEEAGFSSVKKLGEGMWGQVFLVRKNGTNVIFAAKTIPKTTRITWDGIQVAPKAERLREEIRALRALNGQRHCVRLTGILESREVLTVLMEHVDGLDVLQHCNELKLFTEKSAARIISQLFDAVAHCHDCGVVHRDIKVNTRSWWLEVGPVVIFLDIHANAAPTATSNAVMIPGPLL